MYLIVIHPIKSSSRVVSHLIDSKLDTVKSFKSTYTKTPYKGGVFTKTIKKLEIKKSNIVHGFSFEEGLDHIKFLINIRSIISDDDRLFNELVLEYPNELVEKKYYYKNNHPDCNKTYYVSVTFKNNLVVSYSFEWIKKNKKKEFSKKIFNINTQKMNQDKLLKTLKSL